MIDYVISTVSELFPVYVSGKETSNRYIEDKFFIPDLYPASTPLVGLYSALKTVEQEAVFLISGDMPLAQKGLIRFLGSKLSGNIDAVVPFYEMPQTTFAFYKKSCLNVIQEALKNNIFSLKTMLRKLKVRYIYEKEMRKFDKDLVSFFNINTPAQLEIGKKLLDVNRSDKF